MKRPTPMVDAVAFKINRDVVVDIYPANEVCPAQFARGLEAARERIKRLEEAGDYLCAAAAFMGWHDKIEDWNKAKEDKL